MKQEWEAGAPVADEHGRLIVFKDASGFSYTVQEQRPDGTHVRVFFDPRQPVQSVEVEARARTWEEAESLVRAALARQPGDEVRPKGGGAARGQPGFFFVRFSKGRVPLD